jgi:uncharacterized protein with von Willebrand factor type A (vWA) domain
MVSDDTGRDHHGDQEPGRAHHGFRYGPWRGGPDPLRPPFDVRAAIDKIGQDVLSAGTVRDSLRDLMRNGLDGRSGLDRLADKIRKLRAQARRRGDLGETWIVHRARSTSARHRAETLAGSDTEDAQLAELELETLPDDVGKSEPSTTTRGDPTRRVPSSKRSEHAAA